MRQRLPLLLLALLGFVPAVTAADARARQKLYVTNSTGDDVTVIDTATNKARGRRSCGA